MPASTAPIPTSVNAAVGMLSAKPSWCNSVPAKAPTPAPTNSVGVKTPPTVPLPTEQAVRMLSYEQRARVASLLAGYRHLLPGCAAHVGALIQAARRG